MDGLQTNSDSTFFDGNYFDFPDLKYRVNAVLEIETKGGWHSSNVQTLISFICFGCALSCNLTSWGFWLMDHSNIYYLISSIILSFLWYLWSRQRSVRKPLFTTHSDYQVFLQSTFIACAIQYIVTYNLHYAHPKLYLYELSLSNCKYCLLFIATLFVFFNLVLIDRESFLNRLRYSIEQEINKSERALLTRRDLSFIYIQSLATDLTNSINIMHDLLKQFNLKSEDEIHIGPVHPSTAGMVLFSNLNTMYESSHRLISIEKFVSSYFASFRCKNYAPVNTNKFQLGSLLQKIGDMVGPIANRENVDIVIDDIDFAFRDLPVYGDAIDLLHILSDAVKFSIVSSVPNSSIEIGVRLPTLNQRQNDPDRPNSVCYPFVFHITYTTLATTDILDSMDWIMRPLDFLQKITNTKVTNHRTADKRTLYFTSNLCIPEDSAGNLHTPFHQLPELASTIRMFKQYQVWIVSGSASTFSRYLETCCSILERKVQKFNMSDPTYFIRALRNLGEQATSPLRPAIMIDDNLNTFCQVINCLLNRHQLTGSGRRIPQCDVIYFLVASDYLEATQFLESALQKAHSGTFPKVTLVLKPIGFRRFFKYFSALHTAHPLSPTRRLQRLIDPDTLPSTPSMPIKTTDFSPPIANSNSGSQILSPRITHRPRVSPSAAPNNAMQRTYLRSPQSSPHKEAPQHFPKSPGNPTVHNGKSPLSSHTSDKMEPVMPQPPKPLIRTLSKTGKTKTSALAKAKASKSLSGSKAKISPNESYFPQVQYLPINVLIVEDNPINQTILATFMRKRNISYSVANDGREALQKWKDGSFHLVLMDIQLPVMSGIEATKEIRRIEKTRKIGCFPSESPTHQSLTGALTDPLPSPGTPPTPLQSPVIIVALTASSLRADRTEALAAGCNDFLTKPVSLVWLEKKIMEWGCMQALIDVQGWRRSKSKTPAASSSTLSRDSIAEFSRNTPTKPNFTINPESIMSKVKKRIKQDAQPASN